MKTSTTIFFRAIGVYLLLTLPAFLEPIFYFYSALFMLMYCWFAGFIFCLVFYLLQLRRVNYDKAHIVLVITIPISVAIALQLMEFLAPGIMFGKQVYFYCFQLPLLLLDG